MTTLRTSTNNFVGSDGSAETSTPSQFSSVQPSSGLPVTTTTEVLSRGWLRMSPSSGLSTFIIVQNMMVAPCENTTALRSPLS